MRGALAKAALALVLASSPRAAHAQAWTRDQGRAYVGLTARGMSGARYYGPDFAAIPLASTYTQLSMALHAEVGVLDRWLTATLSGELYRRNELSGQGRVEGLGDLRLGVFSGLVTEPFRLTAGVVLGIPTGDATPDAGAGADAEARLIAASLPTGDGEWDVEPTLLAGTSFGGGAWPLAHYAVASAGWAIRTRGYHHGLSWRAELGSKLDVPVLDRVWLIVKLYGHESFASSADAAASGFSGLGDAVTHTSLGVQLQARLLAGLGASIGMDTAFRARSLLAATPFSVGLSYEL